MKSRIIGSASSRSDLEAASISNESKQFEVIHCAEVCT